jgi:thiol-disulfide isomerase/thioredoxin
LVALGGLVAIVSAVVGLLYAAGLIGNQGGGEGIAAVTLLDSPQPAARTGLEIGPQVGKLAPDFEISDIDGMRYRLSDFRGKAVYVNFWATWCTPCIKELPEIQEIQDNHPGDLVVITVNRREPVDRARNFLGNLPRTGGGTGLDFAVDGMDPDDTLYSEYKGLGMPVSFFIAPNGVITRLYNGIISLETMEEALEEALAVSRGPG